MPRLMLNTGKLATKEELATDDLVVQMVKDAEEKGKKDAPTKETILQALKVEEVPEGIKTSLLKDVPTKEKIVQALTVEDVATLPEAVKQKILEDAKVEPVVPEVVKNFAKQVMQAAKTEVKGTVNDPEHPEKKSIYQTMQEEMAAFQ